MRKNLKLLYIALLVVLGATIYANSIHGEFIWDDHVLIKDNIYIRNWKLIPRVFIKDTAVNAFDQSKPYRPVQTLTYMADYFFGKLNPTGYHLTNIFLHILVTLCLYGFIMILFGNGTLALGTAALFLVHPVHVEAVSYISGRNDMLALLFMLLSFMIYIKRTQSRSLASYALLLLTYSLALLSKENAIIFPGLLLVYHYAFKKKIRLLDFISVASLAGIFVFLRMTLLKSTLIHISAAETAFDRLPGIFAAIVTYCRLLFAPFDLHLGYGKPLFSWTDPKVLFGIFIVACLLTYAFKKRNKDALTFFGIAWFFVAFIPVSNIYPLSFYMAEHWLYVPSIGFFLIVMQKILFFSQSKKYQNYAKWIFVAMLCFYSFVTIRQNEYWSDQIAFYKKTMQFSPPSAVIYNNLGMVYEEKGMIAEAFDFYHKAISTNPDFIKTYNNLGLLYTSLGRRSDAVALYEKAIRISPDYPDTYNNLAVIYATLGKSEEAIALCRKAVQLDPNYASAYYNLGNIYNGLARYNNAVTAFQKALQLNPAHAKAYDGLGFAYRGLGWDDEAIAFFKKALKFSPGYVSAYYNLSLAYKDKKQYPEASAALEKALEMEPKNVDVLNALASLYRATGQFSKASDLYHKALALDAGNPVLYFNLGNVSLAMERHSEAISLYKKAIEINPQFAEAYDNLAFAYFHEGQYQLAAENADQAARFGVSNPELLEALKPYRNGKPSGKPGVPK